MQHLKKINEIARKHIKRLYCKNEALILKKFFLKNGDDANVQKRNTVNEKQSCSENLSSVYDI
jgi:hypothetical protein